MLLLAVWQILCLLPYGLALAWKSRVWRDRLKQGFFRGVAWIMGLRLQIEGTLDPRRPLLLTANHCSYLDIIVLAALGPVIFTPKAEIGGWPVIGWLTRISGAIFIERSPSRIHAAKASIAEALKQGEVVCVFPEGTTNNGVRVLPFKSAMFSLAESIGSPDTPLFIQPVAIRYRRLNGVPLPRAWMPLIAWCGDEDLAPHAWHFLGLGKLTVEIRLHPALPVSANISRKELTDQCRRIIVNQ